MQNRLINVFLLITSILVASIPAASAASTNDISATVQIASYDINSTFMSGTGFFVSSMGTVLTSTDVIWDSNTNAPREDISIFTIDSESDVPVAAYTMEVWAYSENYNLALLSPKNPMDEQGFVVDNYIGFNNSMGNAFISFVSYSPSNGDNLEFISFDDVSFQSPLTMNSTTVAGYTKDTITVTDSVGLMSSGGPVFYNDSVVGLRLEGTGVVRSETIYQWFQELTTDFTLTQSFIDVTFGEDFSSVSVEEPVDKEPVDETPDITTTIVPTSTTTDTTDYSDLSQEVQDFISSIQTFVREGQAMMDGELVKFSDLTAKEQSLYPSDEVNPFIYAQIDPENFPISSFPDVGLNHPNSDAITGLANMGIIKGYPDGTFGPDLDINRAELTKMVTLMRVITLPQVEDFNGCFPDVGSEWFAPYVCFAESVGWIDGYPDGTFKPSQNVNRAEALKIILNSWFYETGVIPTVDNGEPYPVDASSTDWYSPFLSYAVQDDLLDLQHANYTNGFEYFVGDNMTRKEVAETIARLLQK